MLYTPKMRQTNPLVPVLQVTREGRRGASDADVILGEGSQGEAPAAREIGWAETLFERLCVVITRDDPPALFNAGNHDFQLNRGLKAVSL